MPRLRYCSACGEQKARAAQMQIGASVTVASRSEGDSISYALRQLGCFSSVRKASGGFRVTREAAPRLLIKQIVADLRPGEAMPVPTLARANCLRATAYTLGIRLKLQRTPTGLQMLRLAA